jgi:RNA polymerase sigma factor (TIGR02999 family)
MRRILIENARRKRRLRHGGDKQRQPLNEARLPDEEADDRLLAVDEALDKLAREEPAIAEVVKLRFFLGFSIEKTADVLSLSVRTVNRHWAYARAWLYQELRAAENPDLGRTLLDD